MTPGAEAHFEDLITELAASFVHVEPDALDDQIVQSLRRIVLFLGIDRSTMGRFDDARSQLMATHSWAIPGVEPLPSPLRTADFPTLSERVHGGEQIVLERVGDLPADCATDLHSLRSMGLKSMATFPLTAGGQTLGWLSFGSVRSEREWPEALIRRLRLIAGVFANALARRQRETELRQALVENERLRHRLESENAVWREEVLHAHEHEAVVGESRLLHQITQQVDQVARTNSSVLLLVETGTGKDLIRDIPQAAYGSSSEKTATPNSPTLTLAEVERTHIQTVCAQCGWRINGKGNTADQLGLNPNTLRSKMKKLGIKRPSQANGAEPLEPA